MSSSEYAGLVAVVTGGASGIGYGLAESLVKLGIKVVIGDLQDDAGKNAAARLNEGQSDTMAHFHQCNVRDWDSNRALFQAAIDTFGTVDFAFPNAGVSGFGFPGAVDRDITQPPNISAVDINLIGVIYTMQAALDVMRVKPDPASLPETAHPFRKRWRGKIVATSSQTALYPLPGSAIYTAAKSGVFGLCQATGLLMIPEKIAINCVAPAMVETPIYAAAPDVMRVAKERGDVTPLSTITKAFLSVLPVEDDRTGQCLEATLDRVVARDWHPYLDEAHKVAWEYHWFSDASRNYKHGAKIYKAPA